MSLLLACSSALLALLAPQAFAAITGYGTTNPCSLIGGCLTGGAEETVIRNLIADAGYYLVGIAGGAAVLFLVIGGAQMMTAFGDEGKFTKGTQNIIVAVVGFGIVLSSQVIVGFVDFSAGPLSTMTGGNPVVSFMELAVNAMLTLFNVVFVGILLVAGIKVIIGRGKAEEFTASKKAFGYALAGAIVINVSHALAIAAFNAFT